MHILLLTRLDDLQTQRIRDVAAAEGQALISRDQTAAGESGVPVTAIIGGPPPELTAHMHQLDWVQLRTDCLEGWEECLNNLHRRGVVVTRTRGSYNDTVPDHAMMLVLALARDLPRLLQQRRAHQWKGEGTEPLVLSRATLGLIGMGTIGGRIAERALAFGLRVIGVDPDPPAVPEGVERVVGPDALHEVLAECDIVVVTAPVTATTVGLIGAEALACLKPSALLVNVGRGLVVDTEALVTALDDGRLAGAALDVVDPSPLPEDHPLWDHPKVLLTCHTAKSGSNFGAAQFESVLENVRRYVRGEPLQNIVRPGDWC